MSGLMLAPVDGAVGILGMLSLIVRMMMMTMIVMMTDLYGDNDFSVIIDMH